MSGTLLIDEHRGSFPQIVAAGVGDGATIVSYVPAPGTVSKMTAPVAFTVAFDQGTPLCAGLPVVDVIYAQLVFIRGTVLPAMEPFVKR